MNKNSTPSFPNEIAQGMSANETTIEPTTVPPPATDPPATDLPATDPPAPANETLSGSFEDPITNETVGDPTTAPPPAYDPLEDPAYQWIMSRQNYNIPHKCYVTVTSNPRDVTNKKFPVVWCDFKFPLGLNVTAEIKDGSCDDFEEQSSSVVFTRGVASPIFLPKITEEEKLEGLVEHAYCARMDYLFDADGTGDHARSVLDKRFPMGITYQYEEHVDKETGQILNEELVDVKLTDENTTEDERNLEMVLGLSFLAGAMFTVALIAIIKGGKRKKKKKEKQRVQRMMEEGAVDVEITPIVAPTREENEII